MRRLLVANRGEIACRIIHAAKALGIETVSVYSDADTGSLHTKLADHAVHIGPAPAKQSYLNSEKVLEAGLAHKVDGVHPGYGFLSENIDFAQAAEEAGITWVGPSPETIAQMGNKNKAREIAAACGVPILPGSGRVNSEDKQAIVDLGVQIGYPLLVKAIGGGGGIGMRLVTDPEKLIDTVISTEQIAAQSFGNAGVYLERFVARARHIEIQIFGYGNGEAIHLYERECSIQRRFQKIVEESPAPGLPSLTLEKMANAAGTLAVYQKYSGPGTVEFLVDADTFEFFFLEMNTRIQVEHGVTEMVTGVDLIQSQILQAIGQLQEIQQSEVHRYGAAIECRIYAENPERNFLPSPGVLTRCDFPEPSVNLRIDTGVRAGDKVTPYYDPMVAKLIACGANREQALEHLLNALNNTHIEGIKTNIAFIKRLIQDKTFQRGDIDTQFVERNRDVLLTSNQPKV